jgi:hypothetical protein
VPGFGGDPGAFGCSSADGHTQQALSMQANSELTADKMCNKRNMADASCIRSPAGGNKLDQAA